MKIKPMILLFKDFFFFFKTLILCNTMGKNYVPLHPPYFHMINWRFLFQGGEQKEKEVADGLVIYVSIFLLYYKYVPFVLKICNDLK